MEATPSAAGASSDGFWDLYSRVYDAVYHLIPYRGLLWQAYEALSLEPVVPDALSGATLGNRTLVLSAWLHYGLGNLFFDQMSILMPNGERTSDTRREFIDRHIFYDGLYLGTELLTCMLEDYAQPRPMTDAERTAFLEEIFTAAAKSQSGKAPRKSKSNPEPLLTLRQGTDYAITQLEMVYNARRKADRELKLVERRLDVLKKAGNVGGSVARVWLTGKGGRAKVSYLVNDLRWTPFYDFRLNAEGAAELSLRAILPPLPKGTVAEAVPGLLGTTTNTAAPVKAGHERFPLIAAFSLPVEKERFASSPQPTLAFFTRNSTGWKLPAGDLACYRRGEYLGKALFQGLAPDETGEIVCGQ